MGTSLPKSWALDKRDKAARYVTGEVRDALLLAIPVLCPGVPFEAVVGACLNGGRNENTTGWKSCSDAERAEALRLGRKPLGGDPRSGYGNVNARNLHELGPLGAEAGYTPGLVAVDGTPWATLAKSDGVKRALGREGVTGAAWHGAVRDQLVIGLASVVRHGREVISRLDARIRPTVGLDGLPASWTLWAWALACAGWSAGDGGMARHVNAYADRLAAVPEAQRWALFCRLAGDVDDPGFKHRADEYTALRTRQKIEGARLAARLTGNTCALAWLDDGAADTDAIDAALVRAST
jgi:hypothetical protein